MSNRRPPEFLRVLPYQAAPGAFHMAVDEALLGGGPPTLRLYGWTPVCVTIGYFQALDWEVDAAACRARGIDIVRRATGGGAVLHAHELTYSVIVPQAWLGPHAGIPESYAHLCAPIVVVLQDLGLPTAFAPLNDIVVRGQKVSGNAQTRRDGWVLQHGTILLDADVDLMFLLLRVPDEKLRGHVISNAKARVTSIRQQGVNIAPDALADKLAPAFAATLGRPLVPGALSRAEAAAAEALRDRKYGTAAWTARR